MTKLYWGLISILTLAVVGCQTDTPTQIIGEESSRVLTMSLPQQVTKISLGDKAGKSYPVIWSEDDHLVVNGMVSEEIKIISTDKTRATFRFGKDITYPSNITYPYVASTTADNPKIAFPAEQNYEAGTFAKGSVPMYGYAESKGGAMQLKHLASLLRIPVKAKNGGVVLQKVVITSRSGAKLSGEFSVDCKMGTITPGANAATTLTYNLPANFTLSTSEEIPLYISIPCGT